MIKSLPLTELPKGSSKGFLGFPLSLDLENLDAQIDDNCTIDRCK